MRNKSENYNCNKGKKLQRLYNEIYNVVYFIEEFRYICNFSNKQLVECLDKNKIWKCFNKKSIKYKSFRNRFYWFEDIVKFFNPSLKDDEIALIVKEFKDRFWDTGLDENILIRIKQAAAVIKYIITNQKTPPEEAFKQYYHSQTIQYIEDNSLYDLTGKQCIEMYKKEKGKEQ